MKITDLVLRGLLNSGGGGAPSPYDSDFQLILDRATALGTNYEHPDPVELAVLNQAMITMKAIGFKDRMDLIRVPAPSTGGKYFRMINWANPNDFLGTMPAGDLTYLDEFGLQAGNSSKYIDDNYNPTNDGVNYTQNNASIMYYKASAQSINTQNGHIQSVDDIARIQPWRNGSNLAYIKINGANLLGNSTAKINTAGLYTVTYDSSDIPGSLNIWHGASRVVSTNVASTGLPNSNMRAAWYGDDYNSFYAYGGDVRDIVSDIDDMVNTLITDLFFLVRAKAFWDFK